MKKRGEQIMERFTLPIGDWSKDGHQKIEIFTIEANKTTKEIVQGYHKTVDALGMVLDSKTGWEKFEEPIELLCDYEEYYIPNNIMEQLISHGLNLDAFVFLQSEDDKTYFEPKDCAILFLEFTKISLKDLEYKFVEDESIITKGLGNIGYGCFD